MEPASAQEWLTLIEYSVRTGVSLSTIRRKIKSNSIPFKLEKGKYLIAYHPVGERPAMQFAQTTPTVSQILTGTLPPSNLVPAPIPMAAPPTPKAPPVSNDTVRMVTDAFEHALKEKEERIRLLERRNRDLESHLEELRFLVQVLEEKYEVHY